MDRALKHYMIATKDGSSKSLKIIKSFYMDGYVMKDEYTKALRFLKTYLDEVKSDQGMKRLQPEVEVIQIKYRYIVYRLLYLLYALLLLV